MKILIVVDVQHDFVDGSLGTPEARAIIPHVRAKIAAYASRRDVIIFTRDTHGDDYLDTPEGKALPVVHCISGTQGWEIYGGLDSGCECLHIDKPAFGWSHWQDTLEPFIDGADEIELIGLCTDICVVTNALLIKTAFPEVKITADASCCAGVTPESHTAALKVLRMCQVNVENG